MNAQPSLAHEIRELLKRHPLTALEVLALLPLRRMPDGNTQRWKARDVHSRLASLMRDKHIDCAADGRYIFLRDPILSPPRPLAERIAHKRATDRARYRAAHPEVVRKNPRNVVPAQAIKPNAKSCLPGRGFSSVEPVREVQPCTESWLAANRNKPGAFQRLRAGDVSPASRFQRIQVAQ